MSLTKRLRILWALTLQRWHQQTCCECKATWWSTGRHHPELIHVCDDCESERIDAMFEFSQREYDRITKGAA